MFTEMRDGRASPQGGLFLQMSHLGPDNVRRQFKGMVERCADCGFDLAGGLVEVVPTAHYLMGGVETDLHGRTSVDGLFAAGEAACTGLHGANRLASNSLLEGLVFGARAAEAMKGSMVRASFATAAERYCQDPAPIAPPSASDVRDLMWRQAGLVRSDSSLRPAVAQLSAWRSAIATARDRTPGDRELRRVASLVTVGLLIARAALRRKESRGGHFREDFPRRDDIHWQKHVADILAR
jgi:aspartate oxidase